MYKQEESGESTSFDKDSDDVECEEEDDEEMEEDQAFIDDHDLEEKMISCFAVESISSGLDNDR